MTDCNEPDGSAKVTTSSAKVTTIAGGSEEANRGEDCAEKILAILADEPHTVRCVALALVVETFVAHQIESGAPAGTALGMVLATAFARAPDAELLEGYRFARDERAKMRGAR